MDLKVELINQDELKNYFKRWGRFSAKCYNTPLKYAERVGKHCLKSGHMSGSRSIYFEFDVSGISRACATQMNRHEIGVVKNLKSQRYCDDSNSECVIPPVIEKIPEAKLVFEAQVQNALLSYKTLQNILAEHGITGEKANQDARYILSEGTVTEGTYAFTTEALINFAHKRLCSRAQWEIREVARKMCKQAIEVVPELKDKLVPTCVDRGYCIEDKCCGLRPKKEDVIPSLDYTL
jgi:thymidylate synthase (FAD)